jgi:hypothetical protein
VPTEPAEPTLAQVVHRAVEVVDPTAAEDGPAQLLERFEDRDEPVAGVAGVDEVLAEGRGAIDPQDEDPFVVMAVAVAVFLAFRRTEIDDDPDELLKLAARAEFAGRPPDHVAAWLAERGVTV